MRFRRDSEKHRERPQHGQWTAHLHTYPSTVAAFLAFDNEVATGRSGRDFRDERERW